MRKKDLLLSPRQLLLRLLWRTARLWPDIVYLKLEGLLSMGYVMDLENPVTYQEKLNWLKLHYHTPLLTQCVDKYEVKKYVGNIIGNEYIVPTLGCWNQFDDIDFSTLPDRFVLKCTHDSASYIIVKDKNKFNINSARKKLEKCLKKSYYYQHREWPYLNCVHRIIAEPFLDQGDQGPLLDYKFFCFDGEPKFMYISADTSDEARTDFFDMDFVRLDMRMKDPNSDSYPPKPLKFEEMKTLARMLSKSFVHVRVDFYIIKNQVFFGELTFFHNGGVQPIYPAKWNRILGGWMTLPKVLK